MNIPYKTDHFYSDRLNNMAQSWKNLNLNDIDDEDFDKEIQNKIL